MPNWGSAAGSAATGAGTGFLFGGPVGAAIGGGAGFLSGLFGGGGSKKPADTEALDPILKNLQDSSAASRRTADQFSGMGAEALAPVISYFKSIMGSDPGAVLAATAPERGRVIDQYDTARKAIANFAPRGGESAGAVANSYVTEGQDLSAITSSARRAAADTTAQIGLQLQGLGLTADQLASADLNTVIQAILSQQGLDLTKSGQHAQLAAGLSEGLGTLLGLYLTRGSGAGAGTGAGA